MVVHCFFARIDQPTRGVTDALAFVGEQASLPQFCATTNSPYAILWAVRQ